MKETTVNLKEQLKSKQYKLTAQRQKVLSVFEQDISGHLSAEDVYKVLQSDDENIGLATIYRTLELLSSIGILKKLNFGDGRARYELDDETTEHQHHHLLCVECGTVIEFDYDLFEELEKEIAKKNGFHVTDHNVTFLGQCKDCYNNSRKIY